MPKVTLNSIGSRYGSIDALNDNFDAIEAAIENTLSLDGTSPNAMEAALDMNSNAILNASTIYAGSVVIAGQSLEPGSASNVSTVQVSEFTATAGQTSFSVSPFTPSSTGVIMEVNGVTLPTSSISVTGSVVSFPALQAGDEAVIRTFTREVGGSNNASDIAFLQTGAATTRTVQSKLRDVFSVKDYAVVGDGTTNDTAAFQVAVDAVAAAGGGDLYIPNGTYSLDTINMKEGVRLVGQGKGAILQQRTSSLVYLFQVNSVSNVGFVNLTIDVNNGAGADGLGTVAIFHRGVTAAANNFLAKDCKFINGLIRPYLDFRSSLASRGVFILDNEFIGKATLTTATAPQTQTTQAIRFLCVGGCGLWEIRGNTSKYCGLFLQTRHVSTQATLSRTLASGAISITTTAATTLYLDTEGAAATDDLDTITNTTPTNGQEITLFATNDARDVVVRHNTGNISLSGGTNITLGNGVSFVTLRWNSTSSTWVQVEQFDSVVVSDNMYTDALDDPNVSTSPYELFCITGLTVTGNTIRSGGRGFNGSYVKSASYTGNVAYDQTKYFFEMVVCDGVTISGNTAYNCKTFINDTSPVSGSSNITIVGNSIVGGSIGEVGYDANTFTNVITMMPTRTYSHWRIADNIFSGQQWTTSTIRIDGVATDFEVLNNQFIQSEETQKPRAILVNAGSNIRIVGNVIKRSVNITNATESGNNTYAFIELTTGSGGSDIRVEDNLIRWTGTDARTGGNNTGVIGIGGNLAAAALAKVFVRRNSLLGTFTAPLRLQITSGDTVVEDNDLSGATGAVSFNSAVTFPQVVVDVRQFNAKGDNVVDDTAALQAAINAAKGGELHLERGKTYRITDALLVNSSNVRIVGNGATIDGSTIAASTTLNDKYALKIEGSIGSAVAITANLTRGAVDVSVSSTSGIVAGDVILVYSTTERYPEGFGSGSSAYRGALHRVRSVNSGTSLTLMDGVFFDYTAASGANIRRLTPVDSVTVEDLRVVMGGANRAHSGIRIRYATQCKLIDCRTRDTEDTGVFFDHAFGGGVFGGDFSNATSPADGTSGVTGNTGYGICPGTASRNIEIVGASIRNCRHAVAGGGVYPSIAVLVKSNKVDGTRSSSFGTTYALDCHEDCMYWVFDSNHVSGSNPSTGSGGMVIRGQFTRVVNNTITSPQQYGILVENFDTNSASAGAILSGNTIVSPRVDAIVINGSTNNPLSEVIVENNTILSPAGDGIILYGTLYARIVGNVLKSFTGVSKSGVRLVGTAATAGNYCGHVVISGNTINAPTLHGIRLDYADSVTISGNQIVGATSEAISLTNCTEVTVNGDKVSTSGASRSGVYINASTKVSVVGVVAENTTTATSQASGVYVLGASNDVTVAGCVFSGFVRGVYSASPANYINVVGVNGRNCTTASVDVSASANTAVAGNL